MNGMKIIAITLIVAGVLGLMYERFTYTKESHDLRIGSLEVSVEDRETVNIPAWCSVGAIVGGLIVLVSVKSGGGRARSANL